MSSITVAQTVVRVLCPKLSDSKPKKINDLTVPKFGEKDHAYIRKLYQHRYVFWKTLPDLLEYVPAVTFVLFQSVRDI
jgi:hypothetical protein